MSHVFCCYCTCCSQYPYKTPIFVCKAFVCKLYICKSFICKTCGSFSPHCSRIVVNVTAHRKPIKYALQKSTSHRIYTNYRHKQYRSTVRPAQSLAFPLFTPTHPHHPLTTAPCHLSLWYAHHSALVGLPQTLPRAASPPHYSSLSHPTAPESTHCLPAHPPLAFVC